jgi:Protein of unknown function (DUF2934)
MTGSINPAQRRWTNARIETDLRAAITELGEFPSRAQLVALGQRSLWDAMRRTGGAEVWRDRLMSDRLPTREEIAARAYQLYEAGADGDSVAHWLAAERELAA